MNQVLKKKVNQNSFLSDFDLLFFSVSTFCIVIFTYRFYFNLCKRFYSAPPLAANLELISSDKTPCRKSAVNYNVTLSKGAKAGKYYKMTGINKMDECLGHCCGSKRCDVAFMVNKNCYLVKCFNSDSCALKQSDNPKFDTMLSVVSKSNTKTTKGRPSPFLLALCSDLFRNFR